MKFKLEIELGNDAMQAGNDVARALHGVAIAIATEHGDDNLGPSDSGRIRDINGNTVGAWKVSR